MPVSHEPYASLRRLPDRLSAMPVVQVNPLEGSLARPVHLGLKGRLNDLDVTATPTAQQEPPGLLRESGHPLFQHDVQNGAGEENTSSTHSGAVQAGHA